MWCECCTGETAKTRNAEQPCGPSSELIISDSDGFVEEILYGEPFTRFIYTNWSQSVMCCKTAPMGNYLESFEEVLHSGTIIQYMYHIIT